MQWLERVSISFIFRVQCFNFEEIDCFTFPSCRNSFRLLVLVTYFAFFLSLFSLSLLSSDALAKQPVWILAINRFVCLVWKIEIHTWKDTTISKPNRTEPNSTKRRVHKINKCSPNQQRDPSIFATFSLETCETFFWLSCLGLCVAFSSLLRATTKKSK